MRDCIGIFRLRRLAIAGLAAFSLLGLAALAPAQEMSCVQGELVSSLLEVEAERIGTRLATLNNAGEVARYIQVINEEPPSAGPAETLLILEHPAYHVARVFLVHNGIVCERYLIGPTLHRKAWTAARGTET